MSISLVYYSNTFADWVTTTNLVVNKVNSIDTADYVKSSGTLTVSVPSAYTSTLDISGRTTFTSNVAFTAGSVTFSNTANAIFSVNTFFNRELTSNNVVKLNNVYANGNVWFSNTSTIRVASNTLISNLNSELLGGSNSSYYIELSNTGIVLAQSAFVRANSSYDRANTGVVQAQAAFGQANTGIVQAQAAFGQANTGVVQAQASFIQANNAYNQANTFSPLAIQAAFGQANSSYDRANTGVVQAQAAFGQANTGVVQAQAAFVRANSSYDRANTGIVQAQAAFVRANSSPTTSLTISTTSPISGGGDLSSNRTLSLASGYGDTQNPFGSKTANQFLAAPNGSAGVPTFRAIVAADVPTLNQNTTGTSSNITQYTVNQSVGTSNDVRFNSLGIGTDASTTTGEIRATNDITAYYSDDKLKTKLGLIDNALEKVLSLDGFYYEANETAQSLGYTVKKEVGVSAQQVQAVLPEIVVPAPIDDKYLTVRYEKLIPLLIEAIKEQQNQINDLKSKLENE